MMDASLLGYGLGHMDASIELTQAMPMPKQDLKDSSRLERKCRTRTIKFADLDSGAEKGSINKLKKKHSSETDLPSILKVKKDTTNTRERRGSTGGRLGGRLGRKKGMMRKSDGNESLARVKQAVDLEKVQKNHSSCGSLDIAGHMSKLQERQNRGLPAWFSKSDPNFESLDLSKFDKGGQRRRRRSSRGKMVPFQRRSYPSSKFCEKELPPLVPYPSKPLAAFGRLSPVFFDPSPIRVKAKVSDVLDMDSERFANELPVLEPEHNESIAISA